MDVSRVSYLAKQLQLGVATESERNEWSDLSGLKCEDPSLTDQSAAPEADINVLVARFGLTGELPVDYRPPLVADFVDIFDFRTALHAVQEAERRFMQMPAELRARFDNDPQRVIEFVGDPANLDECIRLGLAPPKKVEAAPVAPPA